MEYRYLGHSGLQVSELCLGTMQFGWSADEATSHQILSLAYEAGINFIDSADVYSRWVEGNPGGVAEEIIGRWIKQSQIPRPKLVIATKVRGKMGNGPNEGGLSRVHIMQAVEDSLRRLGTDYIDLYQAHAYEEHPPIEETLRAFDDLVHQGKVRYIGASNFPAWRLMQALWTSQRDGLARFVSLQPHYHLLNRAEVERELADVCQTYQLGVIPYSPLAGGFLTGKYRQGSEVDSVRARGVRRYFKPENFALLDKMQELGQAKGGYSISQIALAWQLSDPLITSPIIGPRSLEQTQDNLGAAGLRLSEDEKRVLDEATAWK
ncbi:MAG TPA: aldo/keto reductase [Anaerolineales bacterium]|nr:aldo/keto reductase [Anaerolineales bacterium]